MDKRFLTFTGVLLTVTGWLQLDVTAQSNDIFKWRDAQGNIHFEDHPPVEGAEKIILEDKTQTDGTYNEQMDKQLKLLQIYDEEKQENEQLRKKKHHDEELRQRNCKSAMKNLENIRIASRLYVKTDDPRNPRILTDAERAAVTARAEGDVKRWCKQDP